MARILSEFLTSEIDYPGRSRHLSALVGYLDRTSRVRWQADDLRDVCEFLHLLEIEEVGPSVVPLLSKLARKGSKVFKTMACFPLNRGRAELHQGPDTVNFEAAVDAFQRAIELTEGSSDPRDAEIAREAGEAAHFARQTAVRARIRHLVESNGSQTRDETVRGFTELLHMAGIDPDDVPEDIFDACMPDM